MTDQQTPLESNMDNPRNALIEEIKTKFR